MKSFNGEKNTMHNITFLPTNITAAVEGGTILEAAIAAGLRLDAPCGGRGKCGKCKVRANSETVLACQTLIDGDLTVDLSEAAGHRILMGGLSREVAADPAVKSVIVDVLKPSTSDLRDCYTRLLAALAEKEVEISLVYPEVLQKLYATLEANSYTVEVLYYQNELIAIRKPGEPLYGAAFDIGTTTIAAYLIDLYTGAELASASMLNPQTTYGADVIMRTKYSVEHGVGELTRLIRSALNDLTQECLTHVLGDASNLALVTVVGNTCMHHLFAGINPEPLAYAPYTAAITEALTLNAREFGFSGVLPGAKLFLFPNIAGFVGADTVGAALAAEMDEAEEITLLIDIGTNGEMVLGDKTRLVTCSTAAGPAFEGAAISCGMRGAEGAIDHVTLEVSDPLKPAVKISLSVIGGESTPAKGVCGSGLIDAVSEFVRTGIVDESGKFSFGGSEFSLSPGVTITQKDIREIQLAKGAMAAGIEMMCAKLGISDGDIRRVLIAGAFGSYMRPESACGIGLIPKQLLPVVSAIGNAAGQGAKLAAISIAEFTRAAGLAKKMEYLELAADPAFNDIFVDHLSFE
ncbi:MAG: ASKHA domain-containing protein [Oscillospiraceae bacterium]|jgi:uncharacterized 2Fe-2S/4Fe-4S cluster protein (DUF4445 family)|nr:ASKHA domain-containing protein [Oscillospiraceae bacterium]